MLPLASSYDITYFIFSQTNGTFQPVFLPVIFVNEVTKVLFVTFLCLFVFLYVEGGETQI